MPQYFRDKLKKILQFRSSKLIRKLACKVREDGQRSLDGRLRHLGGRHLVDFELHHSTGPFRGQSHLQYDESTKLELCCFHRLQLLLTAALSQRELRI